MLKKYLFFLSAVLLIIVAFTMSGCTEQASTDNETNASSETDETPAKFTGEQGGQVSIKNGQIILDSTVFSSNLVNYYNAELNGKTVYFFVVKDKNGVYRAAANACQVCHESRTGFTQEGDYMVCNTCGNKYPLEKIATEKGGCNPVPINPNLEEKDNKVVIEQSDLEQIIEFF